MTDYRDKAGIARRVRDLLNAGVARYDYRLVGGMSNYMHVVTADDVQYTYRQPGERARVFVDRQEEAICLQAVSRFAFAPQTVYFNAVTQEKIARFLPGTALSEVAEASYDYAALAALLHELHGAGPIVTVEYNPWGRLARYEDAARQVGAELAPEFTAQKARMVSYRPFLELAPRTFCHGDCQPSNFIAGDRLYLVDYEFAGLNDPLYDIACFGNFKLELGLKLLAAYLGTPSASELRRFYLWRAFQCLQWYLVASFKAKIGMSAKLGLDFGAIAEYYLAENRRLLDLVAAAA